MNVILAVASVAVLWRVPILLAAYMTLVTFDFLMFIAKRVVGLVVIKLLLVKYDDHGGTPFVIGVARIAGLRLKPTVIACPCAHISRDFLVATHAKPILRLAVEFDMTLRAIVFPFRVSLY